MRTIVISGAPPYDGRYEFDQARKFTAREWGWIKRLSGYLPDELDVAMRDAEFSVVVALIALHRAGKISTGEVPQLFERFADAPDLELTAETDEPVDEELESPDPTSPPSSSARPESSGTDSSTSSASSAELPRSNGAPSSAISESDPATSAI